MLILGTILLLAAAAGPPSRLETRPDVDASAKPADTADTAVPARAFQCAPIQVRSEREARRRAAFSASRSLDLGLRTLLRSRQAWTSSVEFRLFTPRGFLYQTLAVPPGPEGPPRREGVREVRSTLLVAGTAITTNSLYGRWTVQALVDGQPCARELGFTLGP